MTYGNTNLTIKYLIDLLNDHTNLKINKKIYLIDSYPTSKIGNISFDNLLTALLFSCKNINYLVDNNNFQIIIDSNILNSTKVELDKFIRNSTFEVSKQKKLINYIQSSIKSDISLIPTNDSIILLTYYFGINLFLYSSESQIIKCFYYDDKLDRELPFIIIKETKDLNSPNQYYELVFSQNKYIFDYSHAIINELIENAFIVGLEQNKQLEYLEQSKVSDVYKDFNDDLEEVTNNEECIQLKLIPTRILKIIHEINTMNFEPIII